MFFMYFLSYFPNKMISLWNSMFLHCLYSASSSNLTPELPLFQIFTVQNIQWLKLKLFVILYNARWLNHIGSVSKLVTHLALSTAKGFRSCKLHLTNSSKLSNKKSVLCCLVVSPQKCFGESFIQKATGVQSSAQAHRLPGGGRRSRHCSLVAACPIPPHFLVSHLGEVKSADFHKAEGAIQALTG